jgi:tetratricopeptide (TPR) repeat protein
VATLETTPIAAIVRSLFISYAREDRVWAEDTARTARGYGMEVFLDSTSIRAGAVWPDALREAIERADLVRLGWSKYAAQSEWVRREYSAALQKPPGSLLIDLLDDTPLPIELGHIQAEKSALGNAAAERLLRDPVRRLPEGRNQPSQLLRPEYGVAPFFGRVETLKEIAAWCTSAPAFSVRLYVAPGGTGKTRLCIEACQRLKPESWDGRFLAEDALGEGLATTPSVVDALFRPRLPRLLIVDYAETRREQVKALLQRALHKHDGPSVRLLLLARSGVDWWEELLGSSAEFRELVQEPEPRWLPPLAPKLAERQLLCTSALNAFAAVWGQPVPSIPNVNLSPPEFSQVFYLHLAALATLLGSARSDVGSMLDLTLEHEERYWQKAAADMKLDSRLKRELQVAAALLTLAGGCRVDQLAEVLAPDAGLAALPPLDSRAIANVFRQLYGFEDRVEALQPELLGERHVAREFRKDKKLRTSWLDWDVPGWLHHGLMVLNQMTSHAPEGEVWLADILQSDPQRFVPPGMQVAIETGDPMGLVLAAVLDQHPTPILARQIERALPQKTTILREFAAVVTRQCLDLPLQDSERVRILTNLGIRFRDLGRHEEALKATQEAIGICRKLAPTRPDALRRDLATILINLGNSFCDLGRQEEALEATQEAVGMCIKLAVARPDAFLPDLAGSLNNLGIRFTCVGRREEALEATQEAVGIYHKLAAARPDAFLPHLAGSLNNLGIKLRDLGRREEALKATQEAVLIHRKLATDHPDAFLPDLARSLDNLGISFSDRQEEALEATQEGIEIYRKLAAARPDAFFPDLARSLNNLGAASSNLGRREEALKATQEAVVIHRKLVAARPDVFLQELAGSLNNLGNAFSDMDRREEAREATQEAVENYRKLVAARPDAFLPDLATSLNNLGNWFSDLDRREEALQATQEAVLIRRKLAADHPDAFLPDLATSLNDLGNWFSDLGRREEALTAIQEASEIRSRLGRNS